MLILQKQLQTMLILHKTVADDVNLTKDNGRRCYFNKR